jgi:hypothetical protein
MENAKRRSFELHLQVFDALLDIVVLGDNVRSLLVLLVIMLFLNQLK